MKNDSITLTRKIQLRLDTEDPEERKECFRKLRNWQHIVYRAANFIASHQYIQEQVRDFFYFSEGALRKLVDTRKDADGILNCSRGNTTYQVLSARFKGQIPTRILNTLNHTLVSAYNKDKIAYMNGEKSVRNFKKDLPIPIAGEDLENITYKDGVFRFRLYRIPFKTYLGKGLSDKKELLRKVAEKSHRLRASSILFREGKIMLCAAFAMEKEQNVLKAELLAEATLSFEHPIVVRIGPYSYRIGNREEILHRRLAIQAARKRAAVSASGNRGGHGVMRKLKNLDRFRNLEKNFIEQKMHLYSRKLIDLCVKHQAATILLAKSMVDEEAAKEDEFLIRNWSYYSLKTKIMYKAEKAGVHVILE